jgi:hypothetical protein
MIRSNDSAAPKVFISHSHVDRAVATNVQQVLHKHQAQTYLDQDRIQAADVLPDRIHQGIEWCNAFLLLWTVSAARSNWVDREWNTAYDLRKKIIPYCLDSTSLPSLLGNLVYVDRNDEQVSHAGLLRAVFGGGFTPSPTDLFPGTWRVKLSAFGLGTATYDLDLRTNGQITGTGKIDQGGVFGEVLAAEGMAGLLNVQSSISGTWEYEEHTEILTFNLIAQGFGREFQETIQIRITGREQGEISGQDFAGRSYVIKRLAGVRDMRAALIEMREAYAKFIGTDFEPETLKDEIVKLLAALEPYENVLQSSRADQSGQTSVPQGAASLAQALRSMYLGKSGKQLAAGVVVAKGIAMTMMNKIDEQLKSLPSKG